MKSLPTLQAHGGTIPGRYWTEFSALRDLCVLPHSARILSFGCSSGDELFTIREFFPDASIVGCDVDPARVDIAKRRTSGWATVFVATPSAIRDTGPFDIVVANSVLMDSSRQNGVDAQAWLDIVSLLTEALAAGGLLQIINSNIAFRRHPHAKDFAPLEHPLVLGSNFASQFDLDGRFLAEELLVLADRRTCTGMLPETIGAISRTQISTTSISKNCSRRRGRQKPKPQML